MSQDVEQQENHTNDKEQPKRLVGIFDLGQETRFQAEGKGHLGRLIEVRLEDVPIPSHALAKSNTRMKIGVLVEDQEALHNLQLVSVRDRLSDLIVELLVGEWLFRHKTLIRKCRPTIRRISTVCWKTNRRETHIILVPSSCG